MLKRPLVWTGIAIAATVGIATVVFWTSIRLQYEGYRVSQLSGDKKMDGIVCLLKLYTESHRTADITRDNYVKKLRLKDGEWSELGGIGGMIGKSPGNFVGIQAARGHLLILSFDNGSGSLEGWTEINDPNLPTDLSGVSAMFE